MRGGLSAIYKFAPDDSIGPLVSYMLSPEAYQVFWKWDHQSLPAFFSPSSCGNPVTVGAGETAWSHKRPDPARHVAWLSTNFVYKQLWIDSSQLNIPCQCRMYGMTYMPFSFSLAGKYADQCRSSSLLASVAVRPSSEYCLSVSLYECHPVHTNR